ncbi:MAG: hypothetical protein ACKVU2_00270 [Saprospiraceae bacterium]
MITQHLNTDLSQPFKKKMTGEEIYGPYFKPDTLLRLEQLAATKSVDLETIGFCLREYNPFTPAPIDIIPFAHTGGDGCYFAFLTDFGYYQDLEQAPIAFISPSDFDKKKPHDANKLFANNIRDFLQIMMVMRSAELTRFKYLPDIDFKTEIERAKMEIEEIPNEEARKMRKQTLNVLEDNFGTFSHSNLNEYYANLYKERFEEECVPLKDGLGLKTRLGLSKSNIDFTQKDVLDMALGEGNQLDRLIFYRESAYLHEYYKDSYLGILAIIAKHLDQDGFGREANIIRFEIEYRLHEKAKREAHLKKFPDSPLHKIQY